MRNRVQSSNTNSKGWMSFTGCYLMLTADLGIIYSTDYYSGWPALEPRRDECPLGWGTVRLSLNLPEAFAAALGCCMAVMHFLRFDHVIDFHLTPTII